MTQQAYRTLLAGVTVLMMLVLAMVLLDRPALAEESTTPDGSIGGWEVPAQVR